MTRLDLHHALVGTDRPIVIDELLFEDPTHPLEERHPLPRRRHVLALLLEDVEELLVLLGARIDALEPLEGVEVIRVVLESRLVLDLSLLDVVESVFEELGDPHQGRDLRLALLVVRAGIEELGEVLPVLLLGVDLLEEVGGEGMRRILFEDLRKSRGGRLGVPHVLVDHAPGLRAIVPGLRGVLLLVGPRREERDQLLPRLAALVERGGSVVGLVTVRVQLEGFAEALDGEVGTRHLLAVEAPHEHVETHGVRVLVRVLGALAQDADRLVPPLGAATREARHLALGAVVAGIVGERLDVRDEGVVLRLEAVLVERGDLAEHVGPRRRVLLALRLLQENLDQPFGVVIGALQLLDPDEGDLVLLVELEDLPVGRLRLFAIVDLVLLDARDSEVERLLHLCVVGLLRGLVQGRHRLVPCMGRLGDALEVHGEVLVGGIGEELVLRPGKRVLVEVGLLLRDPAGLGDRFDGGEELGGVAEPVRRILLERPERHVVEGLEDPPLRGVGRGWLGRPGEVGRHDVDGALALEGRAPRDELVEQDADGVEVALGARALTPGELGIEGLGGAGDREQTRPATDEPIDGAVHEDTRGVAPLPVATLRPHQEDVLALHVRVDDALVVEVAERRQNARDDSAGLVEVHRADATDARGEVLSLDVLRRYPRPAVVEGAHRRDLGDAGDPHGLHRAHGRQVAAHGGAVAGELSFDDLDGDASWSHRFAVVPVVALAVREIDGTDGTGAELLHDAVTTDHRPRGELRSVDTFENLRDSVRGAPALRDHDRVGERLERVLASAVVDQRARERALAGGAADRLGIEAEEIGTEANHVVELEKPLELAAENVGRVVHRTFRKGCVVQAKPGTGTSRSGGRKTGRDVTSGPAPPPLDWREILLSRCPERRQSGSTTRRTSRGTSFSRLIWQQRRTFSSLPKMSRTSSSSSSGLLSPSMPSTTSTRQVPQLAERQL